MIRHQPTPLPLENVAFAAQRLRVTEQRVYIMIRKRILRAPVVVRMGHRVFIHPARLDEFVRRGGAGLPKGSAGDDQHAA